MFIIVFAFARATSQLGPSYLLMERRTCILETAALGILEISSKWEEARVSAIIS